METAAGLTLVHGHSSPPGQADRECAAAPTSTHGRTDGTARTHCGHSSRSALSPSSPPPISPPFDPAHPLFRGRTDAGWCTLSLPSFPPSRPWDTGISQDLIFAKSKLKCPPRPTHGIIWPNYHQNMTCPTRSWKQIFWTIWAFPLCVALQYFLVWHHMSMIELFQHHLYKKHASSVLLFACPFSSPKNVQIKEIWWFMMDFDQQSKQSGFRSLRFVNTESPSFS